MEIELDPNEPKFSRRKKIFVITFIMLFHMPLVLLRCIGEFLEIIKHLFKNYW